METCQYWIQKLEVLPVRAVGWNMGTGRAQHLSAALLCGKWEADDSRMLDLMLEE